MRALVRGLPDSYVHATRGVLDDGSEPIDIELARRQHAAYVRALEGLGFRVEAVPGDEALPDCVFIEDTAVLARGRAVVLRSAHPVRCGEHGVVAEALRRTALDVVELDDGTCDGGDVLRLEDRLVVGRSARTSEAGIAALARAFAPTGMKVQAVDLPAGVLHLKCVCSTPWPGLVVVADGSVDPAVFGDVRIVAVPVEETYAANTVGLGGKVLVADGYPRTVAAVARAGLQSVVLDMSEIRKGDGSLTCLSLRWRG